MKNSNSELNKKNPNQPVACKTSILVVNDSIFETFYIGKVIETGGFSGDVINKFSAWEGLHYLYHLHAAKENLPRLIFLDMRMPDINGLDFLEAFQHLPLEVKSHCRIIVLNGSEEKTVHDRIMDFPQVKYYLTSTLTFEVMHKLNAVIMKLSG